MGENSKIGWTTHTFNPWEGCVKVSLECDFCYADERDNRWHGGAHWGKDSLRLFHVEKYWNQLRKWDKLAAEAGDRHRVFCGSLCDVMEERAELNPLRDRLYGEVEATPNLDYLFLTKRPQNYPKFLPGSWISNPPNNLWLGTTVGVNASMWRIDALKKLDPIVRFVSCEPLLEELIFGDRLNGIHWAIFGGESGRSARTMQLEWVRKGIRDCAASKTLAFVKQFGAQPREGPIRYACELDPIAGTDPLDWPCDMQVQMIPQPLKVAA